jgi:hypothetical protein
MCLFVASRPRLLRRPQQRIISPGPAHVCSRVRCCVVDTRSSSRYDAAFTAAVEKPATKDD